MNGSAENALLAHRPKMTLADLITRWAPELNIATELLRACLIEAIACGELDGTDEEPGLFSVEGGIHWDVHGRELFAAFAKSGQDPRASVELLIDRHELAVSRGVVLAFCQARKLEPPSFWGGMKRKRTGVARGGRPARLRNELTLWYANVSDKDKKASIHALAESYVSDHPHAKLDSVRKTLGQVRLGRKKPGKN